jgi:hypothetical protein
MYYVIILLNYLKPRHVYHLVLRNIAEFHNISSYYHIQLVQVTLAWILFEF